MLKFGQYKTEGQLSLKKKKKTTNNESDTLDTNAKDAIGPICAFQLARYLDRNLCVTYLLETAVQPAS